MFRTNPHTSAIALQARFEPDGDYTTIYIKTATLRGGFFIGIYPIHALDALYFKAFSAFRHHFSARLSFETHDKNI